MACFAHLRDSVPSWITDANQLSVHVHAKRAEFAAETRTRSNGSRKKKSATAGLSSCSSQRSSLRARSAKRGLKRILSRESIREVTKRRRVDEAPEEEEEEEEEEKVVIMYDGHTQKTLEQMVRNIWSAKSSIRSSRISTSMQSALRGRMRMRMSPSIQKEEQQTTTQSSTGLSAIEVDDDGAEAEAEEPLLPDFRLMRKPARQKESPYDFIETQLDAAQNLCETAAYRFLREGNCLDELERLVGAYEMVLEAATTMAEQEEERLQKQEQEQQQEAELKVEKEAEEKRPGSVLTDGADSPEDLNTAVLEVDERSDTSEVSIDITAFRMTRYGQRTLHPFSLTRAAR